jgi:hypothetical protein
MNASTLRSTPHPLASALGIRGDYQRPDTTATLREGLAEYYRVNPGLVDPATIADRRSAAYFHSHDCTHVVFGTHTGPLDEGINDLYTMFGVDIRLRDYLMGFVTTAEGKAITKSLLDLSLLPLLGQTLRLVPRVWRITRRMTKKWPWSVPEALMDRPLVELRREFGIELLRSEVELGRT